MEINTYPETRFISVGREEVPLFHELIRKFAIYEKEEEEFVATVESLEKHIIDEKAAHAYLIMYGEKVAGFYVYYFTFSTLVGKKTLYVKNVFLLEEFRKLGLGKKIFNKAAQDSIANDCMNMEWFCLEWNKPARNFYENKIEAKTKQEWCGYKIDREEIEQMANSSC